MKHISAAAVTKTGRRKNNQDNFMLCGRYAALAHDIFEDRYQDNSGRPFLAAVCDGMGGEESGENASYIGCKTLAEACDRLTAGFVQNKRIVEEAVLSANDHLCEFVRTGKTGRSGSTVVAALIQEDRLYFTNLGDSRLYLMRGGNLIQLTKDHTEGQMMVDAGVLTSEQIKTHPSRNKLNRYLGISREEMRLECPVYRDVALLPGDRLLIASDGVFGTLDNLDMIAILSGDVSVDQKAAGLVDLAYRKGSSDNMTALVIEIENFRTVPTPRSDMKKLQSPAAPQAAAARHRSPAVFVIIGIIAVLLTLIMVLLLCNLKCKKRNAPAGTDTPAATSGSKTEPKPTSKASPEDPKPSDSAAEPEPTSKESPEDPAPSGGAAEPDASPSEPAAGQGTGNDSPGGE